MKYRKKPVVVEAIRCDEALSAARNDWDGLPEWLAAACEGGSVLFGRGQIVIMTLEGDMTAKVGDWIIRGVQGELYPCKPDIFEATYEAVEDQA